MSVAHVGRRGRGERDRRAAAEPLAHLRDAQIAGAEVVAPFADAVRLVHREQRYAELAQPLGRAADVESLGRDVEQLDLAALHARESIGDLRRA